MERKVLGLSQLRLGPNKVSVLGILQPFRDAIKLLTKQSEANYNVNWKLFFFSPSIILVTAIFLWNLLPLNINSTKWAVIIITLLVVLRLGIYPLLIRGWASNRKYATLGAIRGVAQTISYEIRLALIVIQFILFFTSYSAREHQYSSLCLLQRFPAFLIIWLVILLAETNRTPFDFSEGGVWARIWIQYWVRFNRICPNFFEGVCYNFTIFLYLCVILYRCHSIFLYK